MGFASVYANMRLHLCACMTLYSMCVCIWICHIGLFSFNSTEEREFSQGTAQALICSGDSVR